MTDNDNDDDNRLLNPACVYAYVRNSVFFIVGTFMHGYTFKCVIVPIQPTKSERKRARNYFKQSEFGVAKTLSYHFRKRYIIVGLEVSLCVRLSVDKARA